MKHTSFSATLYPLWCRAWLYLTTSHAQRLEQWLANHTTTVISFHIQVAYDVLEQTLIDVIVKLEAGTVSDYELVQAFGCLHELESLHLAESRRLYSSPAEVIVNAIRYVLLPPGQRSVREAYPVSSHFKLNDEFGIAEKLGLKYRWAQLQVDDQLDWSNLADLDSLRGVGCLRLGLAPCATWRDMIWRIDDQDPRGLSGHAPLQCMRANNVEELWGTIEKILVSAYNEQVHVLLFPELVFDGDLLSRTCNWLKQNNLAVPMLRLLVAGSRHALEQEGGRSDWSNRCAVLGQDGRILWEQDKRTAFVQDDQETLTNLQVGCSVGSAFEPTRLGKRIVVRESAVGRLLTPICLDYINGELWSNLGADWYLVPAMTAGLARFEDKAKEMGSRHGAASFVCNAMTHGKHRQLCYLPIIDELPANKVAGHELFTIDVKFIV